MRSAGSGAGGEPDLDELRRRIYRPDATDEDRDRYRMRMAGEPAAVLPPPARGTAPSAGPGLPSRPRTRRGLLLAGALTVLGLVGVGIGALPRAPAEPPSRSPGPVPVDAEARSELVQNLAAGNAAGIAAYLVVHPPPQAIRGTTRLFTVERHGTGPGSFSIAGTPAETRSGRATVLLVVGVPARASWTAYRVRPRRDDRDALQAIERRSGDLQAGALTSTTFRYRLGGRPVRLEVHVPDAVQWGAAVVFSD